MQNTSVTIPGIFTTYMKKFGFQFEFEAVEKKYDSTSTEIDIYYSFKKNLTYVSSYPVLPRNDKEPLRLIHHRSNLLSYIHRDGIAQTPDTEDLSQQGLNLMAGVFLADLVYEITTEYRQNFKEYAEMNFRQNCKKKMSVEEAEYTKGDIAEEIFQLQMAAYEYMVDMTNRYPEIAELLPNGQKLQNSWIG
jgi:hypothetical protein